MKRYNKDIIPFGALCRQWRKRCGISAPDMAAALGIRNTNDIYQFEQGYRASWYILSAYIKAGCDITFEMTLSNTNRTICGYCRHYNDCADHTDFNESFPEVNGCPKFERDDIQ